MGFVTVCHIDIECQVARCATSGYARAMTESLRERRRRRTAEAIVAGALRLFEERGFEGTTIEQIAAAADISRRSFFRYFADKEELFFAEDERLLSVIDETLDSAPDGEPVLDLARRGSAARA